MGDSMTIGDRLARLREVRDLTQEQLAERAGVHVDTIRKSEQGRRQSARVTTLCRRHGPTGDSRRWNSR